jgi:hypothetical protein
MFPKPRSRSSAVTKVNSSAPAVAAKKAVRGMLMKQEQFVRSDNDFVSGYRIFRNFSWGYRIECETDPSAPRLRLECSGSCETFQLRISSTNSLTCSAIDGAEVSPGDSIPISWTTHGNCGSR